MILGSKLMRCVRCDAATGLCLEQPPDELCPKCKAADDKEAALVERIASRVVEKIEERGLDEEVVGRVIDAFYNRPIPTFSMMVPTLRKQILGDDESIAPEVSGGTPCS